MNKNRIEGRIMEFLVLEIENGISTVFHRLKLDEFMPMERMIEIVANRNRQFGHENRVYILSGVPA